MYLENFPPEWKNLPDDQTTACGYPLGYVYPDMYDENNQPRNNLLRGEYFKHDEG